MGFLRAGKVIFIIYISMMIFQLIIINFFYQYQKDMYVTQQENSMVIKTSEIKEGIIEFNELIDRMELAVSIVASVLMTLAYLFYRNAILFGKKVEEDFFLDLESGLPNINAFNRDLMLADNMEIALLNIDRFTTIRFLYGVKNSKEILKKTNKRVGLFCKQNGFSIYHVNADEIIISSNGDNNFKEKIEALSIQIHSTAYEMDTGVEIQVDITIALAKGKELIFERAGMAVIEAKKNRTRLIEYDTLGSFSVGGYCVNSDAIKIVVDALKNNRVLVYYQPIVNGEQKIKKYEALVRILDNEGNVLAPSHFLLAIQKTKYYREITKRVVETVFNDLPSFNVAVSINLTASDISNDEIVGEIERLLAESEDSDRVVFEIVESETVKNLEKLLAFVKMVRFYGGKIAIDDFGTGYSNLEVIRKIKPDYIKIDGSLIKDVDTDETHRLFLEAILKFVNHLELKTIAEFVHNEKIFQITKGLGVDEFQGYYFGKPERK